jgi:hypothetical protein
MRTFNPGPAFRGACVSSLDRSHIKLLGMVAIVVFAAVVCSLGRHHIKWLVHDGLRVYVRWDSSPSPYATAADFTKYAMKLRTQGMLKTAPIVQSPRGSRARWKQNIVTTVFWVGEPAGPNNATPNDRSSWDMNWTASYGGVDPPETSSRRNYIPVAFIPRQNPFYVALPYNDTTHGQFKPEASLIIPWFKQAYAGPGQSVCKDHWIAIRKGNRICYAQWEDCGPFRTDDFPYVFGKERPPANANGGAGLDVSPAVRDYLGLAPIDVTDWQFVEVRDVPQGPWRSYGANNPFVIMQQRAVEPPAKEQETRRDDRTANTTGSN